MTTSFRCKPRELQNTGDDDDHRQRQRQEHFPAQTHELVEAESELVAGFMTEYGSTPYLLFMLGEYVAICTMCALGAILFMGGWLPPIDLPPFNWVPGVIWFVLKLFFMFFLIAMAKAIVPRYRYDQLMRLGWKVFLPLSLAMVIIVAGVLQFAGLAPK
jgi:NADH-quinone oxidoreductase subunit H